MKNLWRAFQFVLPHRGVLALYMLTAFGLAIVGSAPLLLIKAFLDKLEHKPPGPTDKLANVIDGFFSSHFGNDTNYVIAICVSILILWALKATLDMLNTYIGSWLAQRTRTEAIERVMTRLLTLDQEFFDKQKTGDLVSRMVSDGEALRKTVKIFLDFAQQPFMVIALVSYAIYRDPYLFCLAAIGVPLMALPIYRIVRKVTQQSRKYQQKTAGLAQEMLQNLAGIHIIHAYGASEIEAKNFTAMADSLFRTGMKRSWNRAIQRPLTSITMGVGAVAVLAVGGIHVVRDGGNASNFVTFMGALALLYDPVTAITLTIGEIAEFLPSAERTFEILDKKPTIVDLPDAKPCPLLKKEIVFEKVGFDYGRGMVLKDFNLTVHIGEKIGIVGRTGVGKSTLLSLLLRFYDPTEGKILIDGVDIKTVQMDTLRSQMALVNQTPFLFHATAADNIRYGKPGASDDEVIAAAKAAMIHDEIMQQPENYKTLCGERGGELFSGGQRQRMAVARAILRNAPILLLDEATSQLDTFSERRVQEALDKLSANRTSLIVAHRLSTLQHVDRIVVFGDHGGVEAVGAHAELMQTSPTYRRLWAAQHGEHGTVLIDRPHEEAAGE